MGMKGDEWEEKEGWHKTEILSTKVIKWHATSRTGYQRIEFRPVVPRSKLVPILKHFLVGVSSHNGKYVIICPLRAGARIL